MNQSQEELEELEKQLLTPSEDIANKTEQLKNLLEEVLDDETKKLLEELEKLLNEAKQDEKALKLLDKLNNKNQNIENELDRALELFKELLIDKKMDEAISNLDKLAEEQNELAEDKKQSESENKNEKSKQEELTKELDKQKSNIKDLEKLTKNLEKDFEDLDQMGDSAKEEMEKAQNELNQKNNKKADKHQKSASENTKKMSNKLGQMKSARQKEQIEINIEDLKAILHNLLNFSFEQENVMKTIQSLPPNDPRYLQVSQQQFKLKDDAKMIEDSLLSLAKRVFQIQSFITRETRDLNQSISESIQLLKERKPAYAAMKQQYSMTTSNNLALLLDDVLKSMQDQMKSMMSNSSESKPGDKNQKPGKMMPKPGQNMGDLQRQLNERIAKLKNGDMQGKSQSEELARLISQQETLRKALKDLQKLMDKKSPGSSMTDLENKMEETIRELAKKKISPELITRQKEIETRLLEAEKALKERDYDNEREGQQAKNNVKQIPPSLEKYLKRKKTKAKPIYFFVDPNLKPFYKQEINQYFKKLTLKN